jgi:signal transduction histidine kinase
LRDDARGPTQVAPELALKSYEAHRGVAEFVSYIKDPGRTLRLEDAMAADRAGRFERLPPGTIDFGFTNARIWLKLRLRNEMDRPRPSVLALNINYMDEIDAWLVTDGAAQNILHQTGKSAFASRPIADPHLAAPFTLGPGQSAEIYIAYWSTGGTSMPLAVETPGTFAARRADQTALRTSSYSVLGLLVVLSLFLSATMRSRLFLLYAFYVGCALLFVMHGDGETFHYLWPNWPQWTMFVSVPLGYGLIMTAGFFSREFLGTQRAAPRLDKVILGVIGLSAVGIVVGLVGFAREARLAGFLLVLLSSLVFLFGGVRALVARMPGAVYYVIAWSSISLSAVVAFLAVNTSLAPSLVTVELVRWGILIDALMMACALIVHLARIRTERDEVSRRELAAMRMRMDLVDRINALEQRCALAAGAAEASGRARAAAFHDMRQPLLSLRFAVQRLAREPAVARDAAQLEASLAYLENLADALLAEELGLADRAQAGARSGGAGEDAVPSPGAPEGPGERFPAQIVLDALEQMFARDAREKGLRFACVKSSATLAASPLALVRILSNLVANAVKHTKVGGVALGCRRKAGKIWLCVYDTGPGLGPEQQERVAPTETQAARSDESPGGGMGLSIVRRLASEHGLLIEMRSTPGKGSAFAIAVPCA